MCEESIRRELVLLARRKRSRVMSSRWMPHTVTNPETNEPFTDAAAWELVATCLEAGDEVSTVSLEIPAGRVGYVLEKVLANREQLYIKLQLGSGRIIGRSFHVTDHPKPLNKGNLP